jgi:hypothetical protein
LRLPGTTESNWNDRRRARQDAGLFVWSPPFEFKIRKRLFAAGLLVLLLLRLNDPPSRPRIAFAGGAEMDAVARLTTERRQLGSE